MRYRVCDGKFIDESSMKLFTINTDKGRSLLIIVGRKNNILFACDNYCPHRGASLSKSKLACDNDNLVCYLHDFEYNIFSGKLEKIPEKWKDQSSEWKKSANLKIYRIFENDGIIFVDIP
jgi:nitrite reductase/ring-hydroxylating ferredoxin subunit